MATTSTNEYQNIIESISKNLDDYQKRKKIAITDQEREEIDQRIIKLTWQLQEVSKKIDKQQNSESNNNNVAYITHSQKEVKESKTNRYVYDKLGNLLDSQEMGKSLSYYQPDFPYGEKEKEELLKLIDSV